MTQLALCHPRTPPEVLTLVVSGPGDCFEHFAREFVDMCRHDRKLLADRGRCSALGLRARPRRPQHRCSSAGHRSTSRSSQTAQNILQNAP